MFRSPNKENYERLKKLSAIEAIQTWLDGDFGIGDDPALISAIKKGTNTRLSDNEITDCIFDAMDEEETAEECLARITKEK